METAIGVFAARERAEEAIDKLLKQGVPESSVVFLTRSETEAKALGKELGRFAGGFVGGAAGLSAGVAMATLLALPGLGQVFALGIGATALLGLAGAGTGSLIGESAAGKEGAVPTSGTGAADDTAYFRKVLDEGRSLVVVRTDTREIARLASEILDGLGLGIQKGTADKTTVTTRALNGTSVVDVAGRIALGEGTASLREAVRGLLAGGAKKILLHLEHVDSVDSAGLGELVRLSSSIQRHGGKLKLVNPSAKVRELLATTKLDRVFEIEKDEAIAASSI